MIGPDKPVKHGGLIRNLCISVDHLECGFSWFHGPYMLDKPEFMACMYFVDCRRAFEIGDGTYRSAHGGGLMDGKFFVNNFAPYDGIMSVNCNGLDKQICRYYLGRRRCLYWAVLSLRFGFEVLLLSERTGNIENVQQFGTIITHPQTSRGSKLALNSLCYIWNVAGIDYILTSSCIVNYDVTPCSCNS